MVEEVFGNGSLVGAVEGRDGWAAENVIEVSEVFVLNFLRGEVLKDGGFEILVMFFEVLFYGFAFFAVA